MKTVSTIKAKFRRDRPNLQFTRLWEEFDSTIHEHIMSKLALANEEAIIVAYVSNLNNWWLLSNKKVLIQSNGLIKVIALSEIRKIELDTLFEKSTSKLDANLIGLHLQYDRVQIEIEKLAWPTIYNLLRFMIS